MATSRNSTTYPIRQLTRIAVQRGHDEVTVVIYGDGMLPYRVVAVGGNRLGVDLPYVVTSLSFQVLPVVHQLLQEIQISPHAEKLRLVFVVKRPVRYAIKTRENILAIRLKGR
ncbi:MAG: hypothetical protein GKS05_01770 [Nitrospirales bacterium]|nr:hypothetical protein [Nitrospirales bacterium]